MSDNAPNIVAVITQDPETRDRMLDGPSVSPVAFCCRKFGLWYTCTDRCEIPTADTWGLPVVWLGKVIPANCDRLMRLSLQSKPIDEQVNVWKWILGWESGHPVRQYEAHDVAEYAREWARALGAELFIVQPKEQ